jgi:hypothetical protein
MAMTPEHAAKMKAGREAAFAKKRAEAPAAAGNFFNPDGKRPEERAPAHQAVERTPHPTDEPKSPLAATILSADIADQDAPAPEDETLEQRIARIRSTRRPLGTMAQKLALPARAGYSRHWFNDTPGRIEEAEANGWAHVKGTDGSPINRVVGSGRDNGALRAYAMEIPAVIRQEDIDAQHQIAREKVEAIKASPFRSKAGEAKPADSGKFYSPKEDVDPLQVVRHTN